MLIRDFTKCPRCGSPTEKSKSFNGGESEFWYNCVKCNTYINTYVPMAHQVAVHSDTHRFVGNFGGYGSGKTTTSREEFYKHVFLTPGGNSLIGANVSSQYEQTIKRDIENDIPAAFIRDSSAQKQYMDFVNDHRVMFRPFDDPNKLRSYNLSMFVMVEASEVKAESFTQLKTRLRNMTASQPKKNSNGDIIYTRLSNGALKPEIQADWRRGIIESNPDSGWIRRDVLLKSSDIQKHGPIEDVYTVLKEEADPAISTHITTSDVNEFLPSTFKQDLAKNKPLWWCARYLYGSFSYAEGLVYPSAMRFLVDDFEIPTHWKRICAFDYGLADDAVFLFGAVDQDKGLLYIYKEIRTNNRSVEELAKMFTQGAKDIPVGGWITSPIIDPKSAPKRDYNKKSLADHFLDYGVAFKPGYIDVDARIYRLNTYFESSKVRIFKGCKGLIEELRDYKFKLQTSSNDHYADKPEDKNNHAINPLEWIVMELPSDPANLLYGVYGKLGYRLDEEEQAIQARYYIHALSDEDDNEPENEAPFDTIDYFF